MALIHLKHQDKNRQYLFACFRRNMHHRGCTEQQFIEGYNKAKGKDFCSKCANVLINQGKLVAADNTMSASDILVLKKVREGTEQLRLEYMEQVRQWSKKRYAEYKKMNKCTTGEWCLVYGVKMKEQYTFNGIVVSADKEGAVRGVIIEDYGKAYYRMSEARVKCESIITAGYEKFLALELKHAEMHYNDATMKLTLRIMEKSMNINKMEVTNGRVGVNLEVKISDGTNFVTAWTIIAAQDSLVMRPHYRYLVK